MTLVLVKAADFAAAVPLADVKADLNITTDDDDALVQRLILAAIGKLDGPRGLLGRSLAPAQYRVSLSAFLDRIVLPLPPLRSIDTVEYVDARGDPRTLDADEFQPFGVGYDDGGGIARRPGRAWPFVAGGPEAVRITFTAGFVTVPPELRAAITMQVGHLYENREASIVGVSAQVTPMGYDDLVEPFRIWACG